MDLSELNTAIEEIIDPPGTPEATLTRATLLEEKNYWEQEWKNGLGTTYGIAIYPPERDFKDDKFFWKLSKSVINGGCHFTLFPNCECTIIILPNGDDSGTKSSTTLNHRGEEASTTITQLFPYSWNGEWSTFCKVSSPPINHLQFVINRDLGKAQFYVEQIGQPLATENGETGKKLLLGSYALIYAIEGYIRVSLDENATVRVLSKGQTLLIERDEDASPTSLVMLAADEAGNVNVHGHEASVAIIQITETKHSTAPSSTTGDYSVLSIPPSLPINPQRHYYRRKGSLVLYDDQPMWNLPQELAQKLVNKEVAANHSAKLDAEDVPLSPQFAPNIYKSMPERVKQWSAPQQYEPPHFLSRYQAESEVPPPVVRDRLVIEDFPRGTISTAWIKMMKQGLSEWLRLPVIVARGIEDGPVLGITAAVHGNELNGVPCIHRVASEIDVRKLSGTVVAVPCVNVSGYLKFTREFADGKDLNRLFPGREDGFASQVYCYQLMTKIISQFNYLIDLHTASFGRVNSYYVRSDVNDPTSALLAQLQQPQIILHNSGQDGTLRSAAAARGIKAITVEIGNPQLFQNQYVQWSYMGVMRILDYLNMFKLELSAEDAIPLPPKTMLCSRGFWIYTKTGGVLEVYPGVNTLIRKGDLIARIKNIFGNVIDEYFAPCSGITIGRSSNPVAMAGDRIIHLGVISKKGEVLPREAKENY